MVPRRPPRSGQVGFVYAPPYRIQGISIAGEQTVVHVPELDVAFDIGLCPRVALAARFVALSHGHMDHVAGLPYYFSQRVFQKMGVGTCICHAEIAEEMRTMMRSWCGLERQQTRHEIIGLEPDGEVEVKPGVMLRAIEVSHTVPAMGYALVEYRKKLRPELLGQPQDRLRELREKGEEITHTLQIPLIAYTGDTEFGPFLFREEFSRAKIVVTECTFFDADHRERAKIGKHLHVEEVAELVRNWKADAVIVVHTSRRTPLEIAKQRLLELVGEEHAHRVLFLMDHRANRARYEQQRDAVSSTAAQKETEVAERSSNG